MAKWEAFLKRRPYSGCRKKSPSGSSLSPASQTPPPRFLRKPDTWRFRLEHTPFLLRGVTARDVEGVLCVGSHEVSGGGGGAWASARALVSAGAGDSAASSLPGVGVAGSSRSQESLVLADPDPVVSSSPPGGDRRSRTGGRGGSTGDRSRSCSSRLFPPRDRASREVSLCPLSVLGGACLVSGVALSIHGPFAVTVTKALSP